VDPPRTGPHLNGAGPGVEVVGPRGVAIAAVRGGGGGVAAGTTTATTAIIGAVVVTSGHHWPSKTVAQLTREAK
jgi:hypothetical protein